MFHRLAQLAIHADGLHVEMDAFFALFVLFEGSLLKHCCASSVCVRILCVCFLKNLRGSSVPVVVRMAGLPSVVLPGLFSSRADEHPVSLAGSVLRSLKKIFSLLEAKVVILARLVYDLPLLHHRAA